MLSRWSLLKLAAADALPQKSVVVCETVALHPGSDRRTTVLLAESVNSPAELVRQGPILAGGMGFVSGGRHTLGKCASLRQQRRRHPCPPSVACIKVASRNLSSESSTACICAWVKFHHSRISVSVAPSLFAFVRILIESASPLRAASSSRSPVLRRKSATAASTFGEIEPSMVCHAEKQLREVALLDRPSIS